MNISDLFSLFENITVRKFNDKYALYKPLILLYALTKVYQNRDRLIYYTDIDNGVNEMIRKAGISLPDYVQGAAKMRKNISINISRL